jgi:hypothetical protein
VCADWSGSRSGNVDDGVDVGIDSLCPTVVVVDAAVDISVSLSMMPLVWMVTTCLMHMDSYCCCDIDYDEDHGDDVEDEYNYQDSVHVVCAYCLIVYRRMIVMDMCA